MLSEHSDDEKIIDRVRKGDTELYRIIVARYQQKLYAIGMRFCKNHDDACDFTQEVFLKAYNSLGTFKGISRFNFWLVKIAYNHGINSVKAEKPRDSLNEEMLPFRGITPEQSMIRGEIIIALERSLSELPEKYRVCIDLYFFCGLSNFEIAEITGFPLNTVKSNIFRAKNQMRNALTGSIAEEYHEM